MELSDDAIDVLRRATLEQEAIGCGPDANSDCPGCRMVYAVRVVVLDPIDGPSLDVALPPMEGSGDVDSGA